MGRRLILECYRASRGQLSRPGPRSRPTYAVLASLSGSYSPLEGRLPTCYSPVRHFTRSRRNFLVRLACLKPAASVRSEPESNSPIKLSKEFAGLSSCSLDTKPGIGGNPKGARDLPPSFQRAKFIKCQESKCNHKIKLLSRTFFSGRKKPRVRLHAALRLPLGMKLFARCKELSGFELNIALLPRFVKSKLKRAENFFRAGKGGSEAPNTGSPPGHHSCLGRS
jgi:hypothetical protein